MVELYDDYHEDYYTAKQVSDLYDAYLKWCAANKQAPEVSSLEFVDESNIGHVAYHALIWMEENGKLGDDDEEGIPT